MHIIKQVNLSQDVLQPVSCLRDRSCLRNLQIVKINQIEFRYDFVNSLRDNYF